VPVPRQKSGAVFRATDEALARLNLAYVGKGMVEAIQEAGIDFDPRTALRQANGTAVVVQTALVGVIADITREMAQARGSRKESLARCVGYLAGVLNKTNVQMADGASRELGVVRGRVGPDQMRAQQGAVFVPMAVFPVPMPCAENEQKVIEAEVKPG
jgi:hypothetical protein